MIISFSLSLSVYKWEKTLIVVVTLETVVLMFLSALLIVGAQVGRFALLLMFFVGEALIVLSSLYGSLRVHGKAYGAIGVL